MEWCRKRRSKAKSNTFLNRLKLIPLFSAVTKVEGFVACCTIKFWLNIMSIFLLSDSSILSFLISISLQLFFTVSWPPTDPVVALSTEISGLLKYSSDLLTYASGPWTLETAGLLVSVSRSDSATTVSSVEHVEEPGSARKLYIQLDKWS